MFKNILILGASRGLGRAFVLTLAQRCQEGFPESLTLVSRKSDKLIETIHLLDSEFKSKVDIKKQVVDLTNDDSVSSLLVEIAKYDLIIYNAGGGCYGNFDSKEWKDHLWTLKLGLQTPMQLCHKWLQESRSSRGVFALVGSRIAGMNADPMASSYSASKHGLVGFTASLQDELKSRHEEVLLFSPGYMDTEMLPANAEVRRKGLKIMAPEAAALAFWRWILPRGEQETPTTWHRVLN